MGLPEPLETPVSNSSFRGLRLGCFALVLAIVRQAEEPVKVGRGRLCQPLTGSATCLLIVVEGEAPLLGLPVVRRIFARRPILRIPGEGERGSGMNVNVIPG